VIAGLFPFVHIPGLDFDVFMRGWLVVGVGVLVLMGSVYLLLATNTGARTGLMIALTGLFAWLTIMGMIWWIYGIGLKGPGAHWTVREVNRGDLATASFGNARELGADLDNALHGGGGADVAAFFKQAEVAVGEQGAAIPKVGSWKAMLLSNPSRGEAQATVDAFLIGRKEYESNQGYVTIGGFETGGKVKRPPSAVCPTKNPFKVVVRGSCWERVASKLHTIFVQPRHPAHYAVIMVQPSDPRTLVNRPGQAPPVRTPDPNQPVESIILERDLGSVRLPSSMVAIGSSIIFTALALSLHRRDKRQEANRAGTLVPAVAAGRG
jgi:hypothetical protein